MAIQIVDVKTASAEGVSSLNVNKPTGTQAGDLLIAVMSQDDHVTGSITFTPPSGWTELTKYRNGNNITAIFYKKASANEPASYMFQSSNADGSTIAIFALRGVDLRIDSYATGTSVAPAVTAPTSEYLRFSFFGYHSSNVFPAAPSGMTSLFNVPTNYVVSNFGVYGTGTGAQSTSPTSVTAISLVVTGGTTRFKYYDGSAFKPVKRVMRWDGASWQTVKERYFDGTTWR
jgi:hypothetical protein